MRGEKRFTDSPVPRLTSSPLHQSPAVFCPPMLPRLLLLVLLVLLRVLLPSLLAVQSQPPTGVRCSCKGVCSCLVQDTTTKISIALLAPSAPICRLHQTTSVVSVPACRTLLASVSTTKTSTQQTEPPLSKHLSA